jgi:hypothetical protein
LKASSDFKALASQRTWDKDVAVWVGRNRRSHAALPSGSNVTIYSPRPS